MSNSKFWGFRRTASTGVFGVSRRRPQGIHLGTARNEVLYRTGEGRYLEHPDDGRANSSSAQGFTMSRSESLSMHVVLDLTGAVSHQWGSSPIYGSPAHVCSRHHFRSLLFFWHKRAVELRWIAPSGGTSVSLEAASSTADACVDVKISAHFYERGICGAQGLTS